MALGSLIGIIAKENEEDAVREFFELFKTPWEYYNEDRSYAVVVCSGDVSRVPEETLVVIYASEEKHLDSVLGIKLSAQPGPAELTWKGISFPVYNSSATVEGGGDTALEVKGTKRAIGTRIDGYQRKIVRIGYDLFREIETLLCSKQPAEYASVPTLEIHIAILRDLMIEAEVPFLEISPVPHGYDYMACLTHDIDFVGLRNHKLDHTMFGFLYRAVWRTFFDMLRGKATAHKLWENLKAAALLPAVFLGITKDFWVQFDQYRQVERGLKSTFFFLPYKGAPGCANHGPAPSKRACKYDIRDIKGQISQMVSDGCEIGLHGIDAWHDVEMAKRESERVASVAGVPVYGARMHWLYFSKESPRVLEKAGVMYDSSYGYNDAVGFCVGTAQGFRPLGCGEFFELPLLIQDTALFYSGRMDLGEDEAFALCKNIIENVLNFGGVLVINWHDRSLAPERLWGNFYVRLLNEIRSRKVWFGTGSEVTEWFRKRRRARFAQVTGGEGIPKIRIEGLTRDGGPDLKLRLYGDWGTGTETADSQKGYKEIPLRGNMELCLTPASLEPAEATE